MEKTEEEEEEDKRVEFRRNCTLNVLRFIVFGIVAACTIIIIFKSRLTPLITIIRIHFINAMLRLYVFVYRLCVSLIEHPFIEKIIYHIAFAGLKMIDAIYRSYFYLVNLYITLDINKLFIS